VGLSLDAGAGAWTLLLRDFLGAAGAIAAYPNDFMNRHVAEPYSGSCPY
jgi:hypothetical protein